MCEICGQATCMSGCPNAEPKYATTCDECGAGIQVGEDYWEVDGKVYCEDCIDKCRKVGEEV